MQKQDFFYIKVRVELNKFVTDEKLSEIVQELEYTITSKTNCIKVVGTEITEVATDLDFNNNL